MFESIPTLTNSIKENKFENIDKEFSNFAKEFRECILNYQKRGFFSKIFSRASIYEEGIKILEMCASSNVFIKLNYMTRVTSFYNIFPNLMSINSIPQIHLRAYLIYLNAVSSLHETIGTEDVSPFGEILFHATFLVPYDENYDVNSEISKEKDSQFVQTLIDKLLEHLKSHVNIFSFWWSILCESIIPSLLDSPHRRNTTNIETEKIRLFDVSKIYDYFIVALIQDEKTILLQYPELFLRLSHAVITEKPYYIEVLDYIEPLQFSNVFTAAINNRDPKSVALFYESTFDYFDERFESKSNNSSEYIKAKHNYKLLIVDSWNLFSENKDNANAVIDFIAEEMICRPKSFTLFALLHLCYGANIPMTSGIKPVLAQMEEPIRSSATAFACILACAFAHQFLHIDMEYQLPCDTDCISYAISALESPYFQRETKQKIKGIFFTTDKRQWDEGTEYIKRFFSTWENNFGLLIPVSCFVKTLIHIANDLPPYFEIDILSVFSEIIIKLLRASDSYKQPEAVVVCVSTVLDIISFRDAAKFLPGNISAKISLLLLKILTFNDDNLTMRAIYECCKAINTGCPTFMAVVPFLVYVITKFTKLIPTQDVLSALIGARSFFKNFSTIKNAIEVVEKRIRQSIALDSENISDNAKKYFLDGEGELKKSLIEERIDQIFVYWWKTAPPEENKTIINALITLMHCTVSCGSIPTNDILSLFCSMAVIRMYSQETLLALDCMNDIIHHLELLKSTFVDRYITNLIEVFYEQPNIVLLYYITNILIITSRRNKFKNLYYTLEETIPDQFDDFSDLILLFLSQIGKVSSSFSGNISLDDAAAMGITSRQAIQVVESVANDPYVVSILPTLQSVHSFKIIHSPNEEKPKIAVRTVSNAEEEIGTYSTESNNNTDKLKVFEIIRDAIASSKKELLKTPNDVTDSNETDQQETTPISTESTLNAEYKQSFNDELYKTLSVLSILNLLGNNGIELEMPTDTEDISNIISKNCTDSFHISVIYHKKGSKTVEESLRVPWKDTSYLFQQFCSSLGFTSKVKTTLHHSSWGADLNFDIEPLIVENINEISDDVQIIWFDDFISDIKDNKKRTKICIRPLQTGLMQVEIQTTQNKQYGPLNKHNVIVPESLGSFVRSTAATFVSKKVNKNLIKVHQNKIEKIVKIASTQ